MLTGHQSWVFRKRPMITATGVTGGPFEANGNLANDFDLLHEDLWMGKESYEKAHRLLLEEAIKMALQKGKVQKVVRAIKDIQDNAVEQTEDCTESTSCFNEPLGSMVSPTRRDPVDTRVFVLSTADGSPFHAFLTDECDACVSIYFRVEEVFDNCCATLRVLVPGHRDSNDQFAPIDLVSGGDKCCIDLKKVCKVDRLRASTDYITVDLSCFCGVQCIADLNLGLCD